MLTAIRKYIAVFGRANGGVAIVEFAFVAPVMLVLALGGVDVALECTGLFTKREAAAQLLAAGARQLWVMMEHLTKSGDSRVVRRCTYPLTALGAVERVYTNLAVLDVTDQGFAVREMAPGLTLDALQKVTDAPLRMAQN